MNTLNEAPPAAAPVALHETSPVDWPAILAGAVVAAGIAFVFSTFGAALGLALIAPYEGDGSALAELLAVGTWMVWTAVSSVMAGAYIAGRMRRRVALSADEASVRDGIHGLAVWGGALILGAWLLGSAVDTAATTAAQVATAGATVAEDVGAAMTDAATTTEGTDATAAATPRMSEAEMAAAAETARVYGVISAFVTAAALLIAAAGAYWAAGKGGEHRDENRTFARFGRWT